MTDLLHCWIPSAHCPSRWSGSRTDCFLVVLRSDEKTHKFLFTKLTISLHLILPSLSTPCSFFRCWRRPQREVNCFELVEQESCWSAMLLHSFPTKSEVNLTAASRALFHICNLVVHLILYITCSFPLYNDIIFYAYYCMKPILIIFIGL